MDLERLHIAACALISAAPGGEMQITNLNKALFYLDLEALCRLGTSYTGAEYVALRRGPVVQNYKDVLVRSMVSSHRVELIERMVWRYPAKVLRTHGPCASLGVPELDDVVKDIAEAIGGPTAARVSEFSHQNLGWMAAFAAGEGRPINMPVAMQQLVDADAWMEEDLDSDEFDTVLNRTHGDFVEMADA